MYMAVCIFLPEKEGRSELVLEEARKTHILGFEIEKAWALQYHPKYRWILLT